MKTKKHEAPVRIYFTALLCVVLSGCSLGPNKIYFVNSQRKELRDAADQGDKQAQYQLGNSYCCSESSGYWDTNEAISWWCKAAAQGQKEAAAAVKKHGGSCDLSEASPSK